MNINEIDIIARQYMIKAETRKWDESARFTQVSDTGAQCFYCSFSLKCGEMKCIWSDDCACI